MSLERTPLRSARVRIVDVAALAGVSPGTASKALNDAGQLRESTRARVRDAAERLGFEFDARGRALSSGRSYTVGLVTTDSFGRFSLPVLLGAEDALAAGRMAVVMCDTRDDAVREQHYLRSLLARGVDGLIVTGRTADPRPPLPTPLPTVYAFTPSTDERDVSITLDDRRGAAMAAEHLVALGRRRVAVISGPERHGSARRRAEGASAVLGDRRVGDVLFGEWSEAWGRAAVDLLAARDGVDLAGSGGVDAIACGSDQIARGVCDRLRETGRRIAADVAVTGFDDWTVFSETTRPPLTTVDLGLEELGRVAGRALLALVADRRAESVVLEPRLVLRESTLGVA